MDPSFGNAMLKLLVFLVNFLRLSLFYILFIICIGSKFAAVGLAEALNVELKCHMKNCQIKSTLVCPYYINTGMFEGVSDK